MSLFITKNLKNKMQKYFSVPIAQDLQTVKNTRMILWNAFNLRKDELEKFVMHAYS